MQLVLGKYPSLTRKGQRHSRSSGEPAKGLVYSPNLLPPPASPPARIRVLELETVRRSAGTPLPLVLGAGLALPKPRRNRHMFCRRSLLDVVGQSYDGLDYVVLNDIHENNARPWQE